MAIVCAKFFADTSVHWFTVLWLCCQSALDETTPPSHTVLLQQCSLGAEQSRAKCVVFHTQFRSYTSSFVFLRRRQRVTSPLPEAPTITYITGLAVMTTDNDGVDHSIVITVKDPHSLDSSCPAGHEASPCLADGSLSVLLDGEESLFGPGSVVLGQDVVVSAVNLPDPCRSFEFEEYWERRKLADASYGRRLQGKQQSMGEWILEVSYSRDACCGRGASMVF